MELFYRYTPRLKAEEIAELRISVGWDGRIEKYRKKLGNSYFCVACFAGNRLIGYADVVSDGIDDAYIRDLIVNPAYQRRGIGSKLLAMITERIKSDGIKMVHAVFDPSLREFYAKAHFTILSAGVIDNEKG